MAPDFQTDVQIDIQIEARDLSGGMKQKLQLICALILSGFVFAIENMPGPIQCITYIVLDMDKTTSSRELIKEFTASGYFQIVHEALSQREISDLLDQAVVRAVIYIPSNFERRANIILFPPLSPLCSLFSACC